MRKTFWGTPCWAAVLAVLGMAAMAQAQEPGEAGWYVRVIDSGGTINSLEAADNVLWAGKLRRVDVSGSDVLNLGNPGVFEENNAWPAGIGNNFVVQAYADVTIPAGNWAVGWGSDDGGRMTIPGVEFVTSYENNREWPLPEGHTDRLEWPSNRAYRPSYGSFSLDEPLETTIAVSMWDNTSAAALEVFYTNLDDIGITASELTANEEDRPTPDNGWDLLGDSNSASASWDVRVPQSVPGLAYSVSPGQKLTSTISGIQSEVRDSQSSGLLHHWYGRPNVDSLEAAAEFYDVNAGPVVEPDVAAFNPENTWWTGSQTALEGGTTEAPKYPVNIGGQPRALSGIFNVTGNNNYMVGLSGELRFPRDGEYLFADGVDDFSALAIDLNRDGEFSDDELLINDNSATNISRERNEGGMPDGFVSAVVDVPEDGNCGDAVNAADGCWFPIEVVFADRLGGDAGILYWNENEDIPFPAANGADSKIAAENLSELAIPEEFMRGPTGTVVVAANLTATLSSELAYDFEINADGSHDSVEVERTIDVGTTILDLNGATINLVANGDLAGMNGEIQLFSADSITGELAEIVVPAGLTVDTSRLASEGILVLGEGGGNTCNANSGGDLDGDGVVAFPDFLRLSANFGTTTDGSTHTTGDINCDGSINFGDFLVMSANFGKTVNGAAAVPEPTGFALLACSGLLLSGLRRRR